MGQTEKDPHRRKPGRSTFDNGNACGQAGTAGQLSRDRAPTRAKGLGYVRCPLLVGPFSHDHLAGMPLVQTRISSSPRRLAEAFLLCRTPDGILVRGASMGRESPGVRLAERRRHPERRWQSVHASPRRRLACAGTVVSEIWRRSRAPWRDRRADRGSLPRFPNFRRSGSATRAWLAEEAIISAAPGEQRRGSIASWFRTAPQRSSCWCGCSVAGQGTAGPVAAESEQ
jgi:hypothetical protein